MIGVLPGPASRTDALVRPRGSVYTPREGCWVVATPERPDYVFGNYLLLREPPLPHTLPEWRARWHREFAPYPDVSSIVIQWEEPWPGNGVRDLTAWGTNGDVLDESAVLVRSGCATIPAKIPTNIRVRTVGRGADWQKVTDLMTTELGDGTPKSADFIAWRVGELRHRVAAGGVWKTAWSGETLIGSGGVVIGDRLARFQEVLVRTAHRRRGVATALCGALCRLLGATQPEITVVAVATPFSDAERVYRGLGMQRVGTQWSLVEQRRDAHT